MATIILSYRREDTELMVGRICDRLRDHFGRDSVMMDIDSIPYGLDFRKHIKETLKCCDLVLAVIGPRWAALNEAGQSRLADETDWIRIEIEAALAKDVPVIPVLVNGASMPKPKDLPETMQDLAFRQAAPLDMRRDFHAHMDRLIAVMDQLLEPKAGVGEGRGDGGSAAATGREQWHAAESTSTPRSEGRNTQASDEIKVQRAPPHDAKTTVAESVADAQRPLLLRLVVPDTARSDAQSALLAKNWAFVALRGVLAVAVGFIWFLIDKGYLNFLDPNSTQQLLSQLFMRSLLIFLLLDGILAVVSGSRGAGPGEHFVLLILNGVALLVLAGWVAMQQLGLVRVAELERFAQAAPDAAAPFPAEAPASTVPVPSAWPPLEFWLDMSIGFIVVGALLAVASAGLNARYGRLWLTLAGIAWVCSGAFSYLVSDAVNPGWGELTWVSDILAITAGIALFVLALQLQARNQERVAGA